MLSHRHYAYVPFSVVDAFSVGRQTREGSRTLEYAFEDFAIHQVAQLLAKTEDQANYYSRSLVGVNFHETINRLTLLASGIATCGMHP